MNVYHLLLNTLSILMYDDRCKIELEELHNSCGGK